MTRCATAARYYASLEDRAARLEAERDAQAKVAAAAERARIARELHDVVAHNVSVMVVQADGASYALGTDPARAGEALAAISATGRQALAEMRRLLGVLRREEGGAELGAGARSPASASWANCSNRRARPGCRCRSLSRATPQPLPSGVALAAYRIVQESLTNTRKHAGPVASASVLLRYSPDALMLTISDDGRGDLGGTALPGGTRARPDRDARAGGDVRRLGHRGPAARRRLRGGGHAAAQPRCGRAPHDASASCSSTTRSWCGPASAWCSTRSRT